MYLHSKGKKDKLCKNGMAAIGRVAYSIGHRRCYGRFMNNPIPHIQDSSLDYTRGKPLTSLCTNIDETFVAEEDQYLSEENHTKQ